jgi:hypothetical protein
MNTIADDAQRISVLFNRIDDLDDVAYSFPDHDDRCERLLGVADATLADEPPIRLSVAASLLGVDENTVREWADNGVLTVTTRRPRLLVDAVSVYELSRLIRDLRAMDDREMLDEMWQRLTDPAAIPRQRSAAHDSAVGRDVGEGAR